MHTWNYEWVIALPSRAWGAGDFHTEKNRWHLPSSHTKSMYSTATYSCSVCSKTCKYRTGTKNLLYFVCGRETKRGRHRENGVRVVRGHKSSQRALATNYIISTAETHLLMWLETHTYTHRATVPTPHISALCLPIYTVEMAMHGLFPPQIKFTETVHKSINNIPA